MNRVFYQHIPKTGGQTLATRMASAYPVDRSSILGPDLNFPDGVEHLRALLDMNDFIERHVNGPVLGEFDDLDILVTVREPVKQIVSNYLHILREPLSLLHRPAKILSPQYFFKQYGDLLANHQTRYFISGYRDLHPDIERIVTWTSIMFGCLDRVRWFVPSEAIDEFCTLWQLETSLPMMLAHENVNVAGSAMTQREELEDIVAAMPELYSTDLLFWQIAGQRYDDYKRHVLAKFTNPYPDNWSHAWKEEGVCGIWLVRGWHQPQRCSYGLSYWGGPERVSEIRIKRDESHRYLVFSVIVYCGIHEQDILLITKDGRSLNLVFRRIDDQEVVYVAELDGVAAEDEILWFKVPEVWSAVMVAPESTDVSRRSVATCRWALAKTPPFPVGI